MNDNEFSIFAKVTKKIIKTNNFLNFRRGAPFLDRIDKAKQRLIEAGLIDYWMDEVSEARARETRASQDDGPSFMNDLNEVIFILD